MAAARKLLIEKSPTANRFCPASAGDFLRHRNEKAIRNIRRLPKIQKLLTMAKIANELGKPRAEKECAIQMVAEYARKSSEHGYWKGDYLYEIDKIAKAFELAGEDIEKGVCLAMLRYIYKGRYTNAGVLQRNFSISLDTEEAVARKAFYKIAARTGDPFFAIDIARVYDLVPEMRMLSRHFD